VLQFDLPEESDTDKSRLTWRGKSVDLHDVQAVFSRRDTLLALIDSDSGSAYLVDSSMNAEMVPPPGEGRFRIGAGVSKRGFWIAYSDGEVGTYGDSEQRVLLKLPSKMP
jgi:hypothetical protein